MRIERALRRITMSGSGPHGKKQRLERSLRSDSSRRRHAAFPRADFLHAEGCALLGLVQPGLAAEPARAKFHRTVRRDHRRLFLPDARRRFLFARGRSARFRRREIISCSTAGDAAPRLDRALHRLGRVPPPIADPASPRLAHAFNIQGPGGWVGYFIGKKLLLTWMGGVGSIILLTGIYVSSLILMTGLRPIHIVRQTVAWHPQWHGRVARMAIETAAAQIGFERAAGDQPAGTRETTARDRKAVEEKRRAGARACRSICFARGIGESAETESGRYHGAAG